MSQIPQSRLKSRQLCSKIAGMIPRCLILLLIFGLLLAACQPSSELAAPAALPQAEAVASKTPFQPLPTTAVADTPTSAPPTATPTLMPSPTPLPSPTALPRTTLLFSGVIVPARCVQAAVDARERGLHL